jgi:uncharacterized protein YbjT (DUF2867 family)
VVAAGETKYATVVEPTRVFLAAATAGVRRLVVCSPIAVGTPAAPGKPHLAANAEVEQMAAACGPEHAILRCSHVLGRGSRLPGLPADGSRFGAKRRCQRAALVWVGDVAAAIAAADDTVEVAAT